MRTILLIVLLLAGCAEPGLPPSEPASDAPGEPEPLAASAPMEPMFVEPAPFHAPQPLGLQVYNGTWGRPHELVARGEAQAGDEPLQLSAPFVPVHVRTQPLEQVQVHAWMMGCCSSGANTQLVDGQGVLHLSPGTWHIEAFAHRNQTFYQDNLMLSIGIDWTINGTVLPLPVEAPGEANVHEIRIEAGEWARNIVMSLSSDGDVRDLRMALWQADHRQCSRPPSPGDLSQNEVLMEGRVDPMARILRIQVGHIPECSPTPAINAGSAQYTLRLSL